MAISTRNFHHLTYFHVICHFHTWPLKCCLFRYLPVQCQTIFFYFIFSSLHLLSHANSFTWRINWWPKEGEVFQLQYGQIENACILFAMFCTIVSELWCCFPTGETSLLTITDGNLTDSSYTFSGLESSATYKFIVESLTFAGASLTDVRVNATTAVDTSISAGYIAFIIIGLAVAACLAAIGIYTISRFVYHTLNNAL